jgi:hypothetical protein
LLQPDPKGSGQTHHAQEPSTRRTCRPIPDATGFEL